MSDVTDRDARLAALMQTVVGLASGVAHEVNNPATYILANTEQMQDQLESIRAALEELRSLFPAGSPERTAVARVLDRTGPVAITNEWKEMLEDNLEGIQRIVAIVKDMHDFTRIEAAGIDSPDLDLAVEAACKLLERQATKRTRRLTAVPDAAPARPRILVIDDERAVLKAYGHMLGASYDVVLAASGSEALALIRTDSRFDAVLCDLMMPNIDGVTLFEELERSHPALAVRMAWISGGAYTPRARAFCKLHEGRVLEKPAKKAAVEALLRMLIAQT